MPFGIGVFGVQFFSKWYVDEEESIAGERRLYD
jgi:hypothetical protein